MTWMATTTPVGRCVMRTADSVVFTCCPPAPDARYTSMRRSWPPEIQSEFKSQHTLLREEAHFEGGDSGWSAVSRHLRGKGSTVAVDLGLLVSQHGHGGGRGLELDVVHRHALHSVHARLPLQPLEGPAALPPGTARKADNHGALTGARGAILAVPCAPEEVPGCAITIISYAPEGFQGALGRLGD